MNASQAFASILRNGGGTFDTRFNYSFHDPDIFSTDFVGGYMVADADAEVIYSVDTFDALCILDYVNDHADALHYGFLGAWISDGFVYLDVSRHYASEFDAGIAAANNNQLAIWDIANGTAIDCSSNV